MRIRSDEDDELVLGGAVRIIEAARGVVEWYAGDFSPIRTDQVSALLVGVGAHLNIFPFESDAIAFTIPAVNGVHPIYVDRYAARVDRQFAIRHELGHVLAGDVDEPTFLSEEGYMCYSERVADLFALADLIPGWGIRYMRKHRTTWRDVLSEIRSAILTQFASSWPDDRVQDRAILRVRLFRECGI